MAELTKKFDATILFAYTSEVYGDAQGTPTPKTYWGNVNPIVARLAIQGKKIR